REQKMLSIVALSQLIVIDPVLPSSMLMTALMRTILPAPIEWWNEKKKETYCEKVQTAKTALLAGQPSIKARGRNELIGFVKEVSAWPLFNAHCFLGVPAVWPSVSSGGSGTKTYLAVN